LQYEKFNLIQFKAVYFDETANELPGIKVTFSGSSPFLVGVEIREKDGYSKMR